MEDEEMWRVEMQAKYTVMQNVIQNDTLTLLCCNKLNAADPTPVHAQDIS